MNIKRKTGKMVCIQRQGYRTLCGQSFVNRVFDRRLNRIVNEPNYIETDEPCACKKCLEIQAKYNI